MPKVNIKQQCSLSPDEAFEKLTSLFENDTDLKKLDPGFTCDFDSAGREGRATGKQFKANLKVNEHADGSEVSVQVDLPFHLGLVKGVVEKTLQKKLQESLT